jgi:hypothetical protein
MGKFGCCDFEKGWSNEISLAFIRGSKVEVVDVRMRCLQPSRVL